MRKSLSGAIMLVASFVVSGNSAMAQGWQFSNFENVPSNRTGFTDYGFNVMGPGTLFVLAENQDNYEWEFDWGFPYENFYTTDDKVPVLVFFDGTRPTAELFMEVGQDGDQSHGTPPFSIDLFDGSPPIQAVPYVGTFNGRVTTFWSVPAPDFVTFGEFAVIHWDYPGVNRQMVYDTWLLNFYWGW